MRMLGGTRSFEPSLSSQAHSTLGKDPSPMIPELFRVDAVRRESIHLPPLAQKAASSPVLGAFALVVGHRYRNCSELGAFRLTNRA
jgi:hypothetical protein